MARIENLTTRQVNLVLVPDTTLNLRGIDTVAIRSKLIELYEAETELVTTQLPQIISVFDQRNQVGVTIAEQDQKIVIGDASVTAYTSRPLEKFVRLVSAVRDIVTGGQAGRIKAYGFNVVSTLDLESTEGEANPINGARHILTKFIVMNTDAEEASTISNLDGTPTGAGVQLIYEHDDTRYQLKLDPRFVRDLEETKSLDVAYNAHRMGNPPAYAELLTFCQRAYDKLNTDLRILE